MKLAFSGDCSVSEAGGVKARLMEALASSEPVEIGFAAVSALDMSFFELLHAAKKSFAEKNRKVAFQADLPEEFAQQAAWAGWGGLCGGG